MKKIHFHSWKELFVKKMEDFYGKEIPKVYCWGKFCPKCGGIKRGEIFYDDCYYDYYKPGSRENEILQKKITQDGKKWFINL